MKPVFLYSLILAAAPYPAHATDQQIGSWVLTCPARSDRDSASCLMRLNKRFLDKAGITADLEVQASGPALVPVITVRGLSTEMLAVSMTGKTEASIRFPGGLRETLTCAATLAGYVCAPTDAAARRLAAALPTAQTVTLQGSVLIDGMMPFPIPQRTVDLSGTTEALVRLRAIGPAQIPAPLPMPAAQSPIGLVQMADKALKAAGYMNGVAGLQELMAKYRKQQAVR